MQSDLCDGFCLSNNHQEKSNGLIELNHPLDSIPVYHLDCLSAMGGMSLIYFAHLFDKYLLSLCLLYYCMICAVYNFLSASNQVLQCIKEYILYSDLFNLTDDR